MSFGPRCGICTARPRIDARVPRLKPTRSAPNSAIWHGYSLLGPLAPPRSHLSSSAGSTSRTVASLALIFSPYAPGGFSQCHPPAALWPVRHEASSVGGPRALSVRRAALIPPAFRPCAALRNKWLLLTQPAPAGYLPSSRQCWNIPYRVPAYEPLRVLRQHALNRL